MKRMSCHINFFLFCFMLFFSSGSASCSGFGEKPELLDSFDFSPTLNAPFASEFYLGRSKINLEKNTLKDVLNLIKSGRIQHQGDAGGSEYSLCYDGWYKGMKFRLWIISGELGGPDHYIDQVTLKMINKNNTDSVAFCYKLPTKFGKVTIKNEIWIGINDKGVEKKIGKPSYMRNSSWLYLYSKEIPNKGNITSVFQLNFSKKIVNSIILLKVTTY